MKFLLDMPVSPTLVKWLGSHGHQAVHAQDIGLSTATDSMILEKAQEENRIIITTDLDFGFLLVLTKQSKPGVILFRGGNYSESEMKDLLFRVISNVDHKTLGKAIAVVDKKRIRVTHLPL
jgi:predicted nuclease of predicted toxin-antitoxin system